MYKSKQFESHHDLINFLNNEHVPAASIVQITHEVVKYEYSMNRHYYTLFYIE
jgi:hypothetical protein